MKLGRVGKALGYLLLGMLLLVMAGRSSPFGGDGGPYILQHDLRADPAGDLIKAVAETLGRFRAVATRETAEHVYTTARFSDTDGGQTP